jgi:hypothetical protein
LQAALDSNPAIGGNVRVSSISFDGSVGDGNDDINTAETRESIETSVSIIVQ